LKREFQNVIPCTPVGWYENARGIATSASLLNILIPLPYLHTETHRVEIKSPSAVETVRRYYDLRRKIRQIKPDAVIADGDMHALRLAQRWKLPSVYVTNLIRPSYGFSPFLVPGERFTERYVKACSKIVVPDNPSPYTICGLNIGNLSDMGIEDRVEFVGSFQDMTPLEGPRQHIFAPISGPLGTRAKLTKLVISTLKKLDVKCVISLGLMGKKAVTKVKNCEIHTWLSREERGEYMKNASLVIFSGGHGTCFETIKYLKPSVCVPTQPEQRGNAKQMQDLGCSVIAKNDEQLKRAIREIEAKEELFTRNVEQVNRFSNKFKGVENAITVIEGLANAQEMAATESIQD